jgi:cytochrome c-type protein NapB
MNAGESPDHHHTGADLIPPRLGRYGSLLAAIVVGVTLFGYLTGIREPHETHRPLPDPANGEGSVPPAVSYSELPNAKLRPNASWEQSLAQLKFDRPGIFDPVVRTEEMKQSALADRARNRAYDGAPPTVPHPSEGLFAANCLACHGEGLKIGDRVASKISHAHLSNCTQCHVEQDRGGLPFKEEPIENGFVGVFRAGPGQRASRGAPPTVPHHTFMRENCTSCHGLVTRPGTRTTHPWLTNCTQCHAPSAFLDQVDFNGVRK